MGSEMCIRDSPSSFLCLYHLSMPQFAWIRWHEAMQSMNGGHKKAAKPSPHTAGTRSKQKVHMGQLLSLIHISEPTRHLRMSSAVLCLKTQIDKIVQPPHQPHKCSPTSQIQIAYHKEH